MAVSRYWVTNYKILTLAVAVTVTYYCRYCQGTGMIVASLLLMLEEEDAFWIMVTIVEDLLPASYYSSTLIGKYI